MIRILFVAVLAVAVVVPPAEAKRAIIIYTPLQKLAHADVVLVGKVTALEKDDVLVAPFAGATDKVSFKVAVVKVENGLVGAANVTHVKVGFIPPPAAAPPGRPLPGRGGSQSVNLTEGTEALFYLTKHHSGEFYTINPITPPIESNANGYKDELALTKKGAAALADPAKALKADKADDRFLAAVVLVTKFRTYPNDGREVETVTVPADESRRVLAALAAGNWKPDGNAVNAYQVFSMLGLTAQDGWKQPMVKPGEDFIAKTREAFTAWLAGPGKDYQIKKIVPKK